MLVQCHHTFGSFSCPECSLFVILCVQDVAKQVIRIAKGGLQRRGQEEEKFLAQLEVIADTGLTQVSSRRRLVELLVFAGGQCIL